MKYPTAQFSGYCLNNNLGLKQPTYLRTFALSSGFFISHGLLWSVFILDRIFQAHKTKKNQEQMNPQYHLDTTIKAIVFIIKICQTAKSLDRQSLLPPFSINDPIAFW